MLAEYRPEQDRGLSPLTADETVALARLVGDVPALWAAPETTMADRKRLVRCLIGEVVLLRDNQPRVTEGLTTLRIGWRGDGLVSVALVATRLGVARSVVGYWCRCGFPEAEQKAALDPRWIRLTAGDLARLDGTLTAQGYGRWRLRDAQRALGLSEEDLYQRVRDGKLIACRVRVGAHWEWRVSPSDQP